MDLPETSLWWTQQHQQQQPMMLLEPIQTTSWSLHHHQPPWFTSEIHENDDTQNEQLQNDTTGVKLVEDDKEPMFEKPLTPSDVGKLNRLVIPKQYAERYFPLGGGGGGGDSGECKGLLLSFEDESGKCWRFRYSYWNSSQSYVLTKGWSRYVKDKRLDAGDVVLFERHRVDSQRLFINWRRRNGNDESAYVSRGVGQQGKGSDKNEVVGVGAGWSRGFYSAHLPYPAHHHHHHHHHQVLPYQHDQCLHAGRVSQGQNQRTKPVGNSSSSRVLRLFGVNMECQPEHEHDSSSTPQCSYDTNNNINNNNMPLTENHKPNTSNSHPHVVRHQPYYF